MKNEKFNFHVVWKGLETGIFDDWEECKHLIIGYSKNDHKGFNSLVEAERAFSLGSKANYKKDLEERRKRETPPPLW